MPHLRASPQLPRMVRAQCSCARGMHVNVYQHGRVAQHGIETSAVLPARAYNVSFATCNPTQPFLHLCTAASTESHPTKQLLMESTMGYCCCIQADMTCGRRMAYRRKQQSPMHGNKPGSAFQQLVWLHESKVHVEQMLMLVITDH